MHKSKKGTLLWLIWFVEGIVVGFGAILPGISGGTLCVAFGMYRPIIEIISNLKEGLKNHFFKLGIFVAGIATGFVGLSGLAAWLLDKNTILVTCIFVGFIIGTMPGLWEDAGSKGRSKASLFAMAISFFVMLVILFFLKTEMSVNIQPGFAGFFLCGLLWGLSFIVPGLSSSSLLLFFGLYQPMLAGISTLNFQVLIPMAIGMILCVLLLAKLMGYAFEKYYSVISHSVLGIVIATTAMIMPVQGGTITNRLGTLGVIFCGAILSYWFTGICNRIQEKVEENGTNR